jgi:hypothetical protein
MLLNTICARTEWEYGESWVPDAKHSILELSPAWCVSLNLDIRRATPWMQFQVCSRGFVLHLGEGLPGRVWKSQQLEWLDDASTQTETYFLRNQIAQALSVKAGLGIPMIMNSQVVAVVVFFMSRARSLDPDLVDRTQAIVQQFQPFSRSK